MIKVHRPYSLIKFLSIIDDNFFLHRKDTQGFFAYPVNDTIAPGYSNIITHPMDFSSMKYKIDSNDYYSLEQFRVRQM